MGNQESLLGSDYPIAQSNCRIVVVGAKSGDQSLLALANLPKEARIIATGNTLEEIQKDGDLYTEVQYQLPRLVLKCYDLPPLCSYLLCRGTCCST